MIFTAYLMIVIIALCVALIVWGIWGVCLSDSYATKNEWRAWRLGGIGSLFTILLWPLAAALIVIAAPFAAIYGMFYLIKILFTDINALMKERQDR